MPSDPLSSDPLSSSPPPVATMMTPSVVTTSLNRRTVSSSSTSSSPWAKHDLDEQVRLFSGGEWNGTDEWKTSQVEDHVETPSSTSGRPTTQVTKTEPRKSSLSATAPAWIEPLKSSSSSPSSPDLAASSTSAVSATTRLNPTAPAFSFNSSPASSSSSSLSQPISIQRSPASSLSRERTTSSAAVYEPSGTPTLANSYAISITPTITGLSSSHHPLHQGVSDSKSSPSTTRDPTSAANQTPTPHTPLQTGSSSRNDKDTLEQMIVSACTSGDLNRLKALLSNTESDEFPSGFTLANKPTSSGLTPLHIAAARGHVDLVRWLIRDAGAMSELEDGEGETALHKAAFKGHVDVCRFLVSEAGVDVDAQDNDGWTAVHNASSLGWLDIAKLLVDSGASIDRRSKHGYTALMNAASKGQLPIIHFLLKRGANVLVRNAWNETAYDLAAAVFETRICSVLAAAEATTWDELPSKPSDASEYNALALHSTVAVVLEENQRLAKPTLRDISSIRAALTAGLRWSSKALSRNDRRTAFTMPKQPATHVVDLPTFRSEVGLPLIGKETTLVLPVQREVRSGGRAGKTPSMSRSASSNVAGTTTTEESTSPSNPRRTSSTAIKSLSAVLSSTGEPSSSSAHVSPTTNGEAAWYWLSDWTVDLTDAQSSPIDGWSYASSFQAPPEEWSSEPPIELERILNGSLSSWGGQKWVRKRRWVRVMRRRLDLNDFGYADLSNSEAHGQDGFNVGQSSDTNLADAEERGASDDYLVRAQFLASNQFFSADENGDIDPARLRKAVASLERAADEIRAGLRTDDDADRRSKAEDALEAMLHQLALIRAELPPEEADEDSDDEFIYDGQDADPDADGRSEFTSFTATAPVRPPSIVSGNSTRSVRAQTGASDYFGLPTSPQRSDLTPQLSRAPDFRVPTHETPRQNDARPSARKIASSGISVPTLNGASGSGIARWESDEAVTECRACSKKFSFFVRKHHCRRCGRIYCHACSNNLDDLDSSEMVEEPAARFRDEDDLYLRPRRHRTCDSCHLVIAQSLPPVGAISTFFTSHMGQMSPHPPPSPSILSAASDAGASDVSELADCPVCGLVLGSLGDRDDQELHVKDCLESGGGSIVHNGRYLIFRLPPGPLEKSECGICYDEFEVGDKLARLNCLCYFHSTCIKSWLERGKTCPYHMSRETS